MLACVGKLSAQGIVHVIPNPQPYYSLFYPGTLDFDIDLIGDGTTDFVLRSNDPETSVNNAVLISQNGNLLVTKASYIAAMTNGETIGSSLDTAYQWSNGKLPIGLVATLLDPETVEDGNFAGQGGGYIGFDLPGGGANYYGWMRVDGGFAGDADIFAYITDWAFETSPNTPIQAGQISEPVSFTANFTGANEVPPNRSGHSGTGTFTLESFVEGFVLTYHLELDGAFVPTSAGIFGPARPNMISRNLIADLGDAVISNLPPIGIVPVGPSLDALLTTDLNRPKPISQPPSILVYDGQIALSANQVVQLLQGRFYVNLKSPRFPGGELRGEIFPTAPVFFSAILSSRNEIPRNASTHRGEAAFALSGADLAGNVALDANLSWNSMGIYDSRNPLPQTLVVPLTNVFGVMIPPGGFPGHPDLPGSPGQALYPEQTILTDEQVYRLKRGEFYINIVTSRFRFGEIGGRILPNE